MIRFFTTAALIVAMIGGAPSVSPNNAWADALSDDASTLTDAGITARFEPHQAHPGDIVTLNVEMKRESWGQFELQIPNQTSVHSIAIEEIPLRLADGQYQQRISWLFQPITSGRIEFQDASVIVVTDEGEQTIGLPNLRLDVQPFPTQKLADTALPLPSSDESPDTNSNAAWMIGIGMVIGFILVAALFRSLRHKPTPTDNSEQAASHATSQLIDKLKAGDAGKDDLLRLLNDPNIAMSDRLRAGLEKAAYSRDFQPGDLAALTAEEGFTDASIAKQSSTQERSV
ncbi:hypothetical protein SAMN06265222_103238 [Neorhodopirellula lusitana]|uniref:Uncharacterized protein n=1 Tax=Neorhodopirellula lusitana TaxID=445327 RepID=A0ABY1PYC1_9BACT|nr:hypothetical protein [Neorhodopirellula lusitana]SMP51187.1 hypothetical protein SAMN06265222_103238 [Neorhodopirellula lusitana]